MAAGTREQGGIIQACQLRLPAPGGVIGCGGLGCNQALYRPATKSIPEQTMAVGVSTKPVAPLLCLVVGRLPGQSSPPGVAGRPMNPATGAHGCLQLMDLAQHHHA